MNGQKRSILCLLKKNHGFMAQWLSHGISMRDGKDIIVDANMFAYVTTQDEKVEAKYNLCITMYNLI